MWQWCKKWRALLALAPLLVSCGVNIGSPSDQSALSPCDQPSAIRGTIASIAVHPSGGNIVASVFIDGSKERPKALYEKVTAFIGNDTQIFRKQGGVCRSAEITALKSGQRIIVQASTAAMSSPPQLPATQIVITS